VAAAQDPRDRKLVPPVALADLPQKQTLAEVFHSAGYRTAIVGKWHRRCGQYPETRGFDYNIGGTL
jgi:arylsulfatase A-like enzyme